ncbi:metallopeptidase family protein [Haliangium sp.]|uniref:metallopeptidase family protein n=1 Tax=Haliangium sp. TaxID=2663208 RepID=UPI003D12D7AA
MDSQLADDIKHAWDCMEQEDFDDAQATVDRARRWLEDARKRGEHDLDADDAELCALGALLADLGGDAKTALEGFRKAHALVPDDPRYLLWGAEAALGGLDDAETAIALCDAALDVAEFDEDLVQAVLLKVEALIVLGDGEDNAGEARALLSELDGCAIEDPASWARAGDLYLVLGDLAAAEGAYQSCVALDDTWADAYHGLGSLYLERGDHAAAVHAWLRTRELDLEAPDEPHHLDPEEFERVAEAALAEIPERPRALLANVPILIDSVPDEALVREGIDPRLLGLFSGVPLPDKSTAGGQAPHLDVIHLFQRNLERVCHTSEQLADEIRITVLHETAHFFGLDDDELHELGLG